MSYPATGIVQVPVRDGLNGMPSPQDLSVPILVELIIPTSHHNTSITPLWRSSFTKCTLWYATEEGFSGKCRYETN
jgi:hypothetical protein